MNYQNQLWNLLLDICAAGNFKMALGEKYIMPIEYYINTDRCPTELLKAFCALTDGQLEQLAGRLIKAGWGCEEKSINAFKSFVKKHVA